MMQTIVSDYPCVVSFCIHKSIDYHGFLRSDGVSLSFVHLPAGSLPVYTVIDRALGSYSLYLQIKTHFGYDRICGQKLKKSLPSGAAYNHQEAPEQGLNNILYLPI